MSSRRVLLLSGTGGIPLVNALSVTNGDMELLLANLRGRVQRAFTEAGVRIVWWVGDTPLVPALAGAGAGEFARIVQEAFTNVVSHAHASQITVHTGLAEDGRSVSAFHH